MRIRIPVAKRMRILEHNKCRLKLFIVCEHFISKSTVPIREQGSQKKNDGPFSQDPTIEQSCVRVLTVIIFKLEPIDADSFFSPSLVYMWCMCVWEKMVKENGGYRVGGGGGGLNWTTGTLGEVVPGRTSDLLDAGVLLLVGVGPAVLGRTGATRLAGCCWDSRDVFS